MIPHAPVDPRTAALLDLIAVRGILPDRFWSKVDLSASGCWLWTGAKDRTGYGQFNVDGRRRQAHRVSFAALRGPIQKGYEVDHLCHTRACVNPEHLRAVTHRVNLQNRRGARSTNPTGARGVHRISNGHFTARVRHKGVDHHGGTFTTIEEAAEAARNLRAQLFHADGTAA